MENQHATKDLFCASLLPGPFGVELSGIDMAKPVSEPLFNAIIRELYAHHIVKIPGQTLSEQQYLDFGQRWGKPILFFDPRLRDVEFPELITIQNSSATPRIARDVAKHWHVDGSYEDPPAAVTMLYAVTAPEIGNETLFCDMAGAYDALDDSMKRRIEPLVVIHGIGDERLLLEGESRGVGTVAHPTVHHPLVWAHPVTGRRTIYGVSGSARGIVGMSDKEGIKLLLDLKRHALQARFCQQAVASTGSIVIWDNFAVMHSATPTEYSDETGKQRKLYRISTRDIIGAREIGMAL